MPNLPDVEMLREELGKLRSKVEQAKIRNGELSTRLETSQEYVEADKQFDAATDRRDEIETRRKELRKQAVSKVLDTTNTSYFSSPSYTRGYNGIETNIRPEVIEAIKAHLQIASLKGSQVEKIASNLIDMIVSSGDIEVMGESKQAQEAVDRARQRLSHIREMFYITNGHITSVYDDEKEIKRLEEVLNNPAKTKKELERMAIPQKLPDIYNTFIENTKTA